MALIPRMGILARTMVSHELEQGTPEAVAPVDTLPIDLDRDVFLRSLVRELSGTLEDVVGLAEASGFISVVGQQIGSAINDSYRSALNAATLDRQQVADTLVDLKRRIGGGFFVLEADDDHIVLGNTTCPFLDKVVGRESMCMMTSNVFGVIAAENLGYGRVELEETIARGDPGCRVTIHLSPSVDPGDGGTGREYFKT